MDFHYYILLISVFSFFNRHFVIIVTFHVTIFQSRVIQVCLFCIRLKVEGFLMQDGRISGLQFALFVRLFTSSLHLLRAGQLKYQSILGCGGLIKMYEHRNSCDCKQSIIAYKSVVVILTVASNM